MPKEGRKHKTTVTAKSPTAARQQIAHPRLRAVIGVEKKKSLGHGTNLNKYVVSWKEHYPHRKR